MNKSFVLFLLLCFNSFSSFSQVNMEAVSLSPMLPATGPNPRFTINMDVDGDGVQDIVYSDYLSVGHIYVMKGLSTGDFSAAVSYAAGSYPLALSPANIDNTGGMDLIAVSPDNDGIYILLNDGTGVFSAPVFYAVGDSPARAVAGDFNEDGKMDLAVTNNYIYSISVLLGDGTGVFASAVNYYTASQPIGISTGDLNKDGHTDIAVAAGQGVSVLLGKGTGTFYGYSQKSFTQYNSAYDVVIADMNKDNNLDLVAAGVQGLYVANGNGTGTFGTFATSPVLLGTPGHLICTDLNGDSYPDAAMLCSGLNIFLNSGTGTFPSYKTYSMGNGMIDFMCTDYDQDGIKDFLSLNAASRSVGFAKGKGDGSFVAVRSYVHAGSARCVVAADFNNDGNADMAISNGDYYVYVHNGNGDGTFAPAIQYSPGPSGVVGMVAVDLNRDGKMDLVGCDISVNELVIFINNGSGFNNPATTISAGTNTQPYSIVAADFNGDGFPDLMTANNSTNGNVSLFVNAGNGSLSAPVTFSIGAGAYDLVASDFNGDGKKDIAVSTVSSYQSKIAILLGDGAGSFAPYTTYACPYARGIKAADIDQDNKIDLVVIQKDTPGNIAVFKGNGDGTFGAASLIPAGINAQGIVVGNFNTDVYPDLAITADEGIVFFTNDGLGTFTKDVRYGAGSRIYASDASSNICTQFGLADFNNDGSKDLLIANTGGSACVMLNNNGPSQPATPASDITITNLSSGSATINWTNGNGKARIVVMKAQSIPVQLPVDGTVYIASTVFQDGSELETDCFVIYNGTGTSVAVTGFSPNTTYYVAVFEYNSSSTDIQYLTSPFPQNHFELVTTTTAVDVKTTVKDALVYPNPFNESTMLHLPHTSSGTLIITDISGKEVKRIVSTNTDTVLINRDAAMPAGLYFYTFLGEGNQITGKISVY